jgi:tetratricopeptide (TPR) repeat protein/DNA-binding CsgD family transcriptional regulator
MGEGRSGSAIHHGAALEGTHPNKAKRMAMTISAIRSMRESGDMNAALQAAQLALDEQTLDGRERAMVMRESGLCLRTLGRYHEALEWYERALQQDGVGHDADLVAKLHVNCGVAHFRLLQFDAAEAAFAVAEQSVPSDAYQTRFMLHTSRAKLYRNSGRLSDAHEQALLAAFIAESTGDRVLRGKALVETAASYAHLGANEEALADAYEAARVLEEANATATLADAYSQIYILLHGLKRHEEALQYAQLAFDLAVNRGSELTFVIMTCNLALALSDVHHDERGLQLLTSLSPRIAAVTSPVARLRTLSVMGQIYNEIGRFQESIDVLEQAMATAAEHNAWLELNNIRFALAQAYSASGRYDEARLQIQAGLRDLESSGGAITKQFVYNLVFAWHLEVSCQRYEDAVAYAERAWAAQQALYSDNFSRLAAALHMKYQVAERERELVLMRQHVTDVEHRLELSRKQLAEMALRRIEQQRSGGSARKAVFSEADWLLFEQQFDEAYRSFMAELLQVSPDLSRAEQRVCTLLVLRMTSKDIAAMLSCSVRTVEWHRLRIRKKLRCESADDLGATLWAMAARVAVRTAKV